MNAQVCLEKLREIKDVAFATVDANGLPQIRIIDIMIVENEKLYFCTARGKDFYNQIIKNGNVAITGMNKEYQMIRLTGKAEKLEEREKWIDRIFKENPSMEYVYPGNSRSILEAFCVQTGSGEIFDLGKEPIVRESFVLGDTTAHKTKFIITEECTQCGNCVRVCPQQCIVDYKIISNQCLLCGLCMEECPSGAIIRD